jgi:integrase
MVQGREKKLRGIYEEPVGSGIWRIQYFDTAGQRHREKVGRRSDAIDLRAKRMVEKLQRRKLPEKFWAKPVTFGELMDDALEHSQDENGVRSTAELKLKYNILRPEFGSLAAEGITRKRVRDWLQNAKQERGWGSDATRNRWQAAFSLAFSVGMNNDKIATNPIAKMKRKPEDNSRVRYLDSKEEVAIRRILGEKFPEHVADFDVSIHTGARSNEQFGLKKIQVDFESGVVKFPNKRREKEKWRYVPLNSVSRAAFKQLMDRNRESPWVFTNTRGDKLRGHRDWFEPTVKLARVKDYTWHDNRHTFASRLAMAGVDLRTVAQLMGHRSIQMTMRYSHLAPDHQQNAVERLVNNQASSSKSRRRRPAKGTFLPKPR